MNDIDSNFLTLREESAKKKKARGHEHEREIEILDRVDQIL